MSLETSGWAYDDAMHKGHRRVHCAHADLCAAEAGALLADDEGIRQIALKDRMVKMESMEHCEIEVECVTAIT